MDRQMGVRGMNEASGSEPGKSRSRRDRVSEWLFKVFGPATVEGAVTGNTPQAREHWKRRVEAAKREREQQRQARADQTGDRR
jgi:hypothetical protein